MQTEKEVFMTRKLISMLVLGTAVAMPLGSIAADDASKAAPPAARNPVDRTADTGADTFKSLDTNRDGYISREEARNSSELSRQFSTLDKDGDGKLSAQELSGWRPGSPSSMGSSPGSTSGGTAGGTSRGSAPVGPGGQPKSGY